MTYLTVKKISVRAGTNGRYPIIYIPKEVMFLLGLKIDDKVVLHVPDNEKKLEIWPVKEFMKKREMGEL